MSKRFSFTETGTEHSRQTGKRVAALMLNMWGKKQYWNNKAQRPFLVHPK